MLKYWNFREYLQNFFIYKIFIFVKITLTKFVCIVHKAVICKRIYKEKIYIVKVAKNNKYFLCPFNKQQKSVKQCFHEHFQVNFCFCEDFLRFLLAIFAKHKNKLSIKFGQNWKQFFHANPNCTHPVHTAPHDCTEVYWTVLQCTVLYVSVP